MSQQSPEASEESNVQFGGESMTYIALKYVLMAHKWPTLKASQDNWMQNPKMDTTLMYKSEQSMHTLSDGTKALQGRHKSEQAVHTFRDRTKALQGRGPELQLTLL